MKNEKKSEQPSKKIVLTAQKIRNLTVQTGVRAGLGTQQTCGYTRCIQ